MFDDEPISRFRNTAASRAAYAREGAIHPVLSMQFHPHEMVLGVGAADAKLNVRTFRRRFVLYEHTKLIHRFLCLHADIPLPGLRFPAWAELHQCASIFRKCFCCNFVSICTQSVPSCS